MASWRGVSPTDPSAVPSAALDLEGDLPGLRPPCCCPLEAGLLGGSRGDFSGSCDGGSCGGERGVRPVSSSGGVAWREGPTPRVTSSLRSDMAAVNR